MRLVYQVEVEAPEEMKPLFVQLIKDITEQALKALVKQMSGAGCPARFTKH
jgi:hypothetical protein